MVIFVFHKVWYLIVELHTGTHGTHSVTHVPCSLRKSVTKMLRLCRISGRAFQTPESKRNFTIQSYAFTSRMSWILSYRIIWQSPVAKVLLLIFQECLCVRRTWNQNVVSGSHNETISNYKFSLYSQVTFISCMFRSFDSSMHMDCIC